MDPLLPAADLDVPFAMMDGTSDVADRSVRTWNFDLSVTFTTTYSVYRFELQSPRHAAPGVGFNAVHVHLRQGTHKMQRAAASGFAIATLSLLRPSPILANDWGIDIKPSYPWFVKGSPRFKEIVVRPGQTVRVASFFSLDQNCAVRGVPEMQVRFPPSKGDVFDAHGTARPAFPRNSDRYGCNAVGRLGDDVYYHAGDGSSGEDHFAIIVVYPDDLASLEWVKVTII